MKDAPVNWQIEKENENTNPVKSSEIRCHIFDIQDIQDGTVSEEWIAAAFGGNIGMGFAANLGANASYWMYQNISVWIA